MAGAGTQGLLSVIEAAVSCPRFANPCAWRSPFDDTSEDDEMHEIPNLPFPSLNPEEHSVAPHAEPAATAQQDGEDASSADQD